MKKLIITSAALLFFVHVFAQQSSFTATVNTNKVTTGDRFQLTLSINNIGRLSDFRPPALNDFYVLGGPNQSSSYIMSNGQTTASQSYSYVLQAKQPGTFVIGSASVKSGGETLTTQPISITVTDKPITSNQNNSSGQNNNSNTDDINSYLKSNFYLKAELSDGVVYKGEPVTVTYKLYENTNSDIVNARVLGVKGSPKFNGFYSQEVDVTNQQGDIEMIDGQRFEVYIIKKTILTPQKAGKLVIDPLSLDVALNVRTKSSNGSNDPFSQFFGDPFGNVQQTEYIASSSPLALDVRDLPSGAPSDFNDAVGKYSMSTEINETTTETDQPLTYRIVISGDGNLSLFQAPQLSLPPGWETYDPKVTDGKSSKTFEYLLIPRSPGKFTIPSYKWSYLDPDKNQYVTLSSEQYDVQVQAGAGYSGTNQPTATEKEEVELLNKDIRYIHKDEPEYENDKDGFLASPVFYAGMGLPFILGIGLFIASAKRRKLESDVAALKNKKANAVARKRLARAKEFARKNETKPFYDEMIRVLWGYISDKLNIPQSELSKENISDYLNRSGAEENTAAKFMQLLNTCELALFAPQLITGSADETYHTAVDVIALLEEEIKK